MHLLYFEVELKKITFMELLETVGVIAKKEYMYSLNRVHMTIKQR